VGTALHICFLALQPAPTCRRIAQDLRVQDRHILQLKKFSRFLFHLQLDTCAKLTCIVRSGDIESEMHSTVSNITPSFDLMCHVTTSKQWIVTIHEYLCLFRASFNFVHSASVSGGHASPEPLVQTHFQKKFLYSLIARDKQQLLRYFNQVNVQQNEENANQPNALLVLLLLLRKLTSH